MGEIILGGCTYLPSPCCTWRHIHVHVEQGRGISIYSSLFLAIHSASPQVRFTFILIVLLINLTQRFGGFFLQFTKIFVNLFFMKITRRLDGQIDQPSNKTNLVKVFIWTNIKIYFGNKKTYWSVIVYVLLRKELPKINLTRTGRTCTVNGARRLAIVK